MLLLGKGGFLSVLRARECRPGLVRHWTARVGVASVAQRVMNTGYSLISPVNHLPSSLVWISRSLL